MSATSLSARAGGRLFYLLPLSWLLLFFLLPFFFVLKISFAESIIAQPPYTPLLETTADGGVRLAVSFGNFRFLIEDALIWRLRHADGAHAGQAATFSRWRPI